MFTHTVVIKKSGTAIEIMCTVGVDGCKKSSGITVDFK
jgi:hypothetical protein